MFISIRAIISSSIIDIIIYRPREPRATCRGARQGTEPGHARVLLAFDVSIIIITIMISMSIRSSSSSSSSIIIIIMFSSSSSSSGGGGGGGSSMYMCI